MNSLNIVLQINLEIFSLNPFAVDLIERRLQLFLHSFQEVSIIIGLVSLVSAYKETLVAAGGLAVLA